MPSLDATLDALLILSLLDYEATMTLLEPETNEFNAINIIQEIEHWMARFYFDCDSMIQATKDTTKDARDTTTTTPTTTTTTIHTHMDQSIRKALCKLAVGCFFRFACSEEAYATRKCRLHWKVDCDLCPCVFRMEHYLGDVTVAKSPHGLGTLPKTLSQVLVFMSEHFRQMEQEHLVQEHGLNLLFKAKQCAIAEGVLCDGKSLESLLVHYMTPTHDDSRLRECADEGAYRGYVEGMKGLVGEWREMVRHPGSGRVKGWGQGSLMEKTLMEGVDVRGFEGELWSFVKCVRDMLPVPGGGIKGQGVEGQADHHNHDTNEMTKEDMGLKQEWKVLIADFMDVLGLEAGLAEWGLADVEKEEKDGSMEEEEDAMEEDVEEEKENVNEQEQQQQEAEEVKSPMEKSVPGQEDDIRTPSAPAIAPSAPAIAPSAPASVSITSSSVPIVSIPSVPVTREAPNSASSMASTTTITDRRSMPMVIEIPKVAVARRSKQFTKEERAVAAALAASSSPIASANVVSGESSSSPAVPITPATTKSTVSLSVSVNKTTVTPILRDVSSLSVASLVAVSVPVVAPVEVDSPPVAETGSGETPGSGGRTTRRRKRSRMSSTPREEMEEDRHEEGEGGRDERRMVSESPSASKTKEAGPSLLDTAMEPQEQAHAEKSLQETTKEGTNEEEEDEDVRCVVVPIERLRPKPRLRIPARKSVRPAGSVQKKARMEVELEEKEEEVRERVEMERLVAAGVPGTEEEGRDAVSPSTSVVQENSTDQNVVQPPQQQPEEEAERGAGSFTDRAAWMTQLQPDSEEVYVSASETAEGTQLPATTFSQVIRDSEPGQPVVDSVFCEMQTEEEERDIDMDEEEEGREVQQQEGEEDAGPAGAVQNGPVVPAPTEPVPFIPVRPILPPFLQAILDAPPSSVFEIKQHTVQEDGRTVVSNAAFFVRGSSLDRFESAAALLACTGIQTEPEEDAAVVEAEEPVEELPEEEARLIDDQREEEEETAVVPQVIVEQEIDVEERVVVEPEEPVEPSIYDEPTEDEDEADRQEFVEELEESGGHDTSVEFIRPDIASTQSSLRRDSSRCFVDVVAMENSPELPNRRTSSPTILLSSPRTAKAQKQNALSSKFLHMATPSYSHPATGFRSPPTLPGPKPNPSHRSILSVVMGGPARMETVSSDLSRRLSAVSSTSSVKGPVVAGSSSTPVPRAHAYNGSSSSSGVLNVQPAVQRPIEDDRRFTMPVNPKNRSGRIQWTNDEVNALEEGLKRFGRQWAMILSHYRRRFHAVRTAVDLKDKARNEKRRRLRSNLELGPWHVAS